MTIDHAELDGERRHPREGQPPAAAIASGRYGAAVRNLTTLALILVALAVWMLCHPYRGIVHDNRIYALLAFNFLDPATFARDVFLAHGSQDSFTLFSPLYAAAITWLGLDWSTKLLVVLGQALWVLGAIALIRRIMAPPFSWLALLFLAAYPPFYGGNSIFAFGEGFLSPRLYAEALGLLAIAAFLGSRYWLAGLLVALGGVLHPLMMLPPAGVILAMAILRNRPWWVPAPAVLSGAFVVIAAMAAIHLSGSSLLTRIDPEWRSIVSNRTPQLMIANWTAGNWLAIACDAMLVGLACLSATPRVRQLFVTVLAVGLASVVTSFVAFDLLGDILTGQAQIWRALWLLHVMAPIGLALLVRDIGLRTGEDRKILLLLALSFPIVTWFCHAAGLPPFGISILILLGAIHVRSGKGPVVSTRRDRFLILSATAVLLAIILAQVLSGLLSTSTVISSPVTAIARSALVSALLAAGWFLAVGTSARAGRLLAGFAVVSVILGSMLWDDRGAWRRYMDSTPDIARELPVEVAPGELVYWPADVIAVWGALGNPSYFSDIQGAGAIFNRDTARLFLRRLEAVSAFEPYAMWKERLTGKRPLAFLEDGMPRARLEDLVTLCTGADHPDVVVLAQDIPGAKGKSWQPRVPHRGLYATPSESERIKATEIVMGVTDTFHFYRCQDLGPSDVGNSSL